jgi:hypothetical protein
MNRRVKLFVTLVFDIPNSIALTYILSDSAPPLGGRGVKNYASNSARYTGY